MNLSVTRQHVTMLSEGFETPTSWLIIPCHRHLHLHPHPPPLLVSGDAIRDVTVAVNVTVTVTVALGSDGNERCSMWSAHCPPHQCTPYSPVLTPSSEMNPIIDPGGWILLPNYP